MRAPNQIRRSTRNRNRRQPSAPANQRRLALFRPKLEYINSVETSDGLLILSKRKRPLLTDEQKAEREEQRKQARRRIDSKKVSVALLRHKVVSIWLHDMFMQNWQFGPKKTANIISFVQATYPQ